VVSRPTPAFAAAGAALLGLVTACVYDLDQLRGAEIAGDSGAQGGSGGGGSGAGGSGGGGSGAGGSAGGVADAPMVDAAGPDVAVTDSPPEATPGLPEVFPDRPVTTGPMTAIGAADLVAYWPMDEGDGMYAWDITGNNNDGVLLLGAAWREAGFPMASFKNDFKMQFDGIGALAEFNGRTIPDIDKPKTISMWIRYDYEVDVKRPQALMVLLNRTKSAGVRIEFREGVLAATTYFYTPIVTLPAPPIGWHHVVYTFDGNTHSLYLNAGPPATSMMAPEVGAVAPPDGRTRLGRSSSTVDDGFKGFIDDVRVYKRALTAAEVKSLSLGTR
jgi:hypothetical protein